MNTYTKLKSGDWGVRVEGAKVTAGQVVSVRKKSGEVKSETIAKVVWSGNGVSLCAIDAAGSGGGSSSSYRRPASNAAAGTTRRSRSSAAGKKGGEQSGKYTSQTKSSAKGPHREVGETCFLKHEGQRLPVAVVGWECWYVRAEDAEDMGDYDGGGWHCSTYYRDATDEERAALEAKDAEANEKKRVAEEAKAKRAALIAELDSILKVDGNRIPELECKLEAGVVEVVAEKGVHGEARARYRVYEDGRTTYHHGGYYDDYRQSQWVTSEPRAAEIVRALATL